MKKILIMSLQVKIYYIKKYYFLILVITLGASGVGKTSLIER